MGDKPCPIIPVPKSLTLDRTERAWPAGFEVTCKSDAAGNLVARFVDGLRRPEGSVMPLHLVAGRTPPEGYTIQLTLDQFVATASAAAGFRHAWQSMRQIMTEPTMLVGTIEDQPALYMRGFHLNFESYRRMDVDMATRLVDAAARFKLNTLLVEYGPRFPFETYPALKAHDALQPADIERLCAIADERGIQIIPLQQCLAHLEYVLGHESFSRLRERHEKANLLCPSHPDALPLVKELISEIIARHPRAKFIHIGGDEARKIGTCPRCSAIAKERGAGELYGKYIGELARWVLDRGLRPIVWDDTLCAWPDAISHLPRETIINYWDYIAVADPTPVLIPRMAHMEGAPRVVHDWRWSIERKRGRLSDVQIDVMKNYSSAARLPAALGSRFMNEFGRYLGNGFPKKMRALPYLEYYQDRGHEVITSPTGMGNGDMTDGMPNFARFAANIATHGRRCKENGRALGMITTAWYNMAPEMLFQPLILTAQSAW